MRHPVCPDATYLALLGKTDDVDRAGLWITLRDRPFQPVDNPAIRPWFDPGLTLVRPWFDPGSVKTDCLGAVVWCACGEHWVDLG